MGRSDQVERMHDHTREELRSLSNVVSDLVRVMRKLGERVTALEDKGGA